MRNLFTTTCLAAVAATLVGMPALAATTVSTDTTTPLNTASAGDVTIGAAGSIKVASGAAVTVDSNNSVTIAKSDTDAGTIDVGSANGAAGIVVNAGTSTTLNNAGAISVTESFVPADDDGNAIADGPIASASNRYGIRALPGGTVTGTITNSGTILVEGLNSGGIVLDSALNGSLINTGTVRVIGDYSTAIRTGSVSGNVHIVNGSVTAVGEGATALAVNGDVGGSVIIQGSVGQASSYTNDNGATVTLSRGDLRVGAPAVSIAGNVAGGVIVAVKPTTSTTDTDVDGDGIADADEGNGAIVAYGNGPALQIGGASPITIGTATGNAGTYSLVIDGTVNANAVYTTTDALGVVIGGQGGTVNLPGGIGISGTVTATTVNTTATALLINQGATVGKLYNSGTITAAITSPGEGAVYAIRDLSGTLTSVGNTGIITVGGTVDDTRRAIDLSANTTGVTISQSLNADDAATRAGIEKNGVTDTTVYTAIRGDIVTGSGNDTLSASDGQIVGNTYFNAGDDTLLLSDRAVYSGKVFFGTGNATAALSGKAAFAGTIDFGGTAGSLTIADTAVFQGIIANGDTSVITVNGGTFGAGAAANSFRVGTLTVNSGGTFNAYIDTATGKSSHVSATTATFASGSKISATVSSIGGAEGTYTILTADRLTSAATFDGSSTTLPFIFAGSVAAVGNDLQLTIRRKAADELGLRRSASQAYNAVIDAAQNDTKMQADILGIADSATLQTQVDELLPDNAGGVFDAVTRGSRLASQHVMDADSIHADYGVGVWLEPVYWRSNKDATDTVAYKASGWGLTGGYEQDVGFGRVGLSYAWLKGKIDNNGGTGKVDTSQHELALSWRLSRGPFYAFARGAAARISLSSARTFSGTANAVAFTYTNTGKWKAWLYSAAGGASYEFDLGERLSLRPQGTIDYYRLNEGGYAETGGGAAMDLTVDKRNSTALNATTSLTASYRFGRRSRDERPLTIEFEGGRRNFLSGDLGTTSAAFANGDVFALTPDRQKSAWIGEARLLSGGFDFTWKLAARAEESQGNMSYGARASLSVAF